MGLSYTPGLWTFGSPYILGTRPSASIIIIIILYRYIWNSILAKVIMSYCVSVPRAIFLETVAKQNWSPSTDNVVVLISPYFHLSDSFQMNCVHVSYYTQVDCGCLAENESIEQTQKSLLDCLENLCHSHGADIPLEWTESALVCHHQ